MIPIKKYQMLPRPYVGSYSGEKGHQILQQPWILALTKSVETFIEVSVGDMLTIKYWQNLGRIMNQAKTMIPKECRTGNTCFTSLVTIGGKLYTRHPKNINHVQKYSKDLLLVIIILGTDVHGGETVFNDGENMNDMKHVSPILHSFGIISSASSKILPKFCQL